MKRILFIAVVVPALIVGAGAAFAHHEPEPETATEEAWIECSIGTLIDGLRSSDMGLSDSEILQFVDAARRGATRGDSGGYDAVPVHDGCSPWSDFEACIDGPNGPCLYRFASCEHDGHVHWRVTLVECGNCQPQS